MYYSSTAPVTGNTNDWTSTATTDANTVNYVCNVNSYYVRSSDEVIEDEIDDDYYRPEIPTRPWSWYRIPLFCFHEIKAPETHARSARGPPYAFLFDIDVAVSNNVAAKEVVMGGTVVHVEVEAAPAKVAPIFQFDITDYINGRSRQFLMVIMAIAKKNGGSFRVSEDFFMDCGPKDQLICCQDPATREIVISIKPGNAA
jgi:hypothetical protein